jgi:hypothetical protein
MIVSNCGIPQVRDAAKTMVDETVEGLPKLARQLNQGVDRFGRDILAARNPFGPGDAAAGHDIRRLPSLDDIFNGRVPEEGASPTSPVLLAPGSRYAIACKSMAACCFCLQSWGNLVYGEQANRWLYMACSG